MYLRTFFALSCLILAVSPARIRRTSDIPVLSDFFESISKHLKEVEHTVLKAFNVENVEDLEQRAMDRGKELTNQLKEWAGDIKNRTERVKQIAVIKEMNLRVDKAIENFKAKHAEAAEEIKNIVEKTQNGTVELMAKVKHLYNNPEEIKIRNLSQSMLHSASEALENLAQKLDDTKVEEKATKQLKDIEKQILEVKPKDVEESANAGANNEV